MILQVGKAAPHFTAEGLFGDEIKKVSLEDYRGKWVILVFYPLDFTFVCPTEVTAFDMEYDKFTEMNTEVLTISVDSVHSHRAWKKEIGIFKLGMLSDMTKDISRNYGVLVEDKGISLRGTFVIDPDGILKIALVHDLNVGRNVEEIIRVVQACQTGELCPIGWKPGQKTLGKG
ncbi:peroxiredoxin [Patescibacteria group bacterium]|nr:peroxiredoxin [Patescibacteria group bacterium]